MPMRPAPICRRLEATASPPLQRFYISYANVWAGNIREEDIRTRTKTDPHSIGLLRTNATLRNIDRFMEAFGIAEGDGMWRAPEERVVIW